MCKLIVGHWYRFNDRGVLHVGQYTGRQKEWECIVCGFGHNCRTFDLHHDKTGANAETWGFGAAHFPEIVADMGEHSTPIVDE